MSSDPTEKVLGILGGMGPAATAHFYQQLVAATPAQTDQDHPRVVIISDPTIPDRTKYLLGSGPDPWPKLVRAAVSLRSAGAGLIVMPCNTASVFIDRLSDHVAVPFVDWIGAAAEEFQGQHSPVGIMATSGTIQTGLYQEALETRNLEHRAPSQSAQRLVMDAIYGPDGLKTTGRSNASSREKLVAVASALKEAGAKSLVLGCTELPVIMAADDPGWPLPTIDPAQTAVTKVLQWIKGVAAPA